MLCASAQTKLFEQTVVTDGIAKSSVLDVSNRALSYSAVPGNI